MAKRRIEPGWRMNVAQRVLGFLFGRPHHFIAPWEMAGVGTAIIFIDVPGRRALLQQRTGAVENAGRWGCFGGYVDLHRHEPLADAVTRELFEETGLRVPADQFRRHPDYVRLGYGEQKHEMAGQASLGIYFFAAAPHDFDGLLGTSDEVAGFRWVDEPTLDTMWDTHELAGARDDHYGGVKAAFAALARGEAIQPLEMLPGSA